MKLKTEHYILGAAAIAVGYAFLNKQSAPAVGAKLKASSLVLKLMDNDYEYQEAVRIAMIAARLYQPNLSKIRLERNLNKFI